MNPIAVFDMSDGSSFTIELFPENAPNTTHNFISLIRKGFYNGSTFHRVVENAYIHGGDPNENGTGGPGYSIIGEFQDNGYINPLLHIRGAVTMVRNAGFDTAGSQFAILVRNLPYLDGHNAVFARVISGMEVVDRIAACETDARDCPIPPQKIKKVSVETFGLSYPSPEIDRYIQMIGKKQVENMD